jgi:hypothetical protein
VAAQALLVTTLEPSLFRTYSLCHKDGLCQLPTRKKCIAPEGSTAIKLKKSRCTECCMRR